MPVLQRLFAHESGVGAADRRPSATQAQACRSRLSLRRLQRTGLFEICREAIRREPGRTVSQLRRARTAERTLCVFVSAQGNRDPLSRSAIVLLEQQFQRICLNVPAIGIQRVRDARRRRAIKGVRGNHHRAGHRGHRRRYFRANQVHPV